MLADLLDTFALVGTAVAVVLALAWIVLHPMAAVALQGGLAAGALAWRFTEPLENFEL
jgi:hypothetical protein